MRLGVLMMVWAVVLAGPVRAGAPLECVFTQECVGDGACDTDTPISLRFEAQGDDWLMQGADGAAIPFVRLAERSGGMRSFLAENADRAASAVSILSIFEDGQAFLSTHGIFLTPGFVTHIGTCMQKGK